MKNSHHFTVLAFDYGVKRIGVAVGQSFTKSSQALAALKANNGIPNWEQLEAIITEWGATHAAVGLPLNMDGSDSELCARTRKFANRLEGRFSLKVSLQDERLTTREAKLIARARGHKGENYAQNPVDGIAAELILNDYWNSQPIDAQS